MDLYLAYSTILSIYYTEHEFNIPLAIKQLTKPWLCISE